MADEFLPGITPTDPEEYEIAYNRTLRRVQLDIMLGELIEAGKLKRAEEVIAEEKKQKNITQPLRAILFLATGKIYIARGNFSDAKASLLESERIEAAHGGWLDAACCLIYLARVYRELEDLEGLLAIRGRFEHYQEQQRVENMTDVTDETVDQFEADHPLPEGFRDEVFDEDTFIAEVEEIMRQYGTIIDSAIEQLSE